MTFLNLDSIEKFTQAYNYGNAEQNREKMLQIIYQFRDYMRNMEFKKQQAIEEVLVEAAVEEDDKMEIEPPQDKLENFGVTIGWAKESRAQVMMLLRDFNKMPSTHMLYHETLALVRQQIGESTSLTKISANMLERSLSGGAAGHSAAVKQISNSAQAAMMGLENIFFSALVNTLIDEGKGHLPFEIQGTNLYAGYKAFYAPFVGDGGALRSVRVVPGEATRLDELMAPRQPQELKLLHCTAFGNVGMKVVRALFTTRRLGGYKIYKGVPEQIKAVLQSKDFAYDAIVRLSEPLVYV